MNILFKHTNKFQGIIFKPVDFKHEGPRILSHLRETYYKESPLHKYLGWNDEYASELDDTIKNKYLTQNLSVVAIDSDTNEIAGVRVNISGSQRQLITKSNLNNQKRSSNSQKVLKMKQLLLKRALVTGEIESERECIGSLVSVSPKYRNRGIAEEIYVKSHVLLKTYGFTVIKPFVSSQIAMNITNRLGYEELSRVYFEEMIGSDGTPDFKYAKVGSFMCYKSLKL